MDLIVEELGVPRKYLKISAREERYTGIVHCSWLKSLLKYGQMIKFIEKEKFEYWSHTNEDIDPSWMKIYITVFKKNEEKVIPLPRIRSISKKDYTHLSFSQLLHYVMQSNHKNLWKDAFKKYTSVHTEKLTESHITLTEYNTVLREIVIRTYGCPIVNVSEPGLSTPFSKYFEPHNNILPVSCAVETRSSIFLIHVPFIAHSLQDCVTFSPSVLDHSNAKPLFIIYQLLQTLLTMHDRSLTIGDITLDDIYVTENLWIQIIPRMSSNLHIQDVLKTNKVQVQNVDCRTSGHNYDCSQRCTNCARKSYDKVTLTNKENLAKLCELWVEGQISNFTYLSALNGRAGRKQGEPNNHHVFPWITDFSSRCGNNWRDLTKSKFRLNKGDRQLDLTFENFQTQVPHHVSDVLSSITYYVYMARRTPKAILCKNVRTVWVPAEYPSSIQRLQEWTPDECIPELFSDPLVFKSIHEDLCDLDLPPWSSSPEDFIERHREALESSYVSERLHHWIDLTFGYKLSGSAAVKSKNVCLQLVDEHTNLTNSGIVQLFSHPHPARMSVSPFTGKLPPKIQIVRQKRRDRTSTPQASDTQRQSEDEDISSGIEDDGASNSPQLSNRSPLVISRLLSRSKSSLNSDEMRTSDTISKNVSKSQKLSPNLGPKYPSFTSHFQTPKASNIQNSSSSISVQKSYIQSGVIHLPKEYNPVAALQSVESYHGFLSKTFRPVPSSTHSKNKNDKYNTVNDSQDLDASFPNEVVEESDTSFTNRIFTESYEAKLRKDRLSHSSPPASHSTDKYTKKLKKSELQSNCNYKQIVATCRMRELQILGCLIVEMFMSRQLRVQGSAISLNFNDRLHLCISVLKYNPDTIPRIIKYAVSLLLQIDLNDVGAIRYPTVTDLGLPPPSAHQLLQPLMRCIFPFPTNFDKLYYFLSLLQEYTNLSYELNILYHFDCNGEQCAKFENIERTKILFTQNIGECKVKFCAKQLENLLFESDVDCSETVNILLPFVRELLEDPSTSVWAAWYLLDSITRALGPTRASDSLLQSVLKLYENEPFESNFVFNSKIAKLYHHSFLLRLIVRLGLKTFLDSFITPLVEAVGGYKDLDRSDITFHSHTQKSMRKTSNLKSIDDSAELDNLSPLDEESSADSEKNVASPNEELKKQVQNEPEMFEFENEDKNPELSPLAGSVVERLEYNVANMDLQLNHSTAEEATEDNVSEIKVEYPEVPKSPTIPIPSSYRQSELNTIGCDVGSKKADEFMSNSDRSKSEIDLETSTYNESKTKEYTQSSSSTFNESSSSIRSDERKLKRNNKISDMSADSLIWLSHRLGPVLTARYLSRNLLRMLTLCYVGKDNLQRISKDESSHSDDIDSVSIVDWRVTGDRNASKVLHCLVSIAALYGEQLILLQYLPHMSELLALCKRKLTVNSEGALISCLVLLKHIIPYLVDSTLMDQLQDVILKNILHPAVRLLGSTKHMFPNGSKARDVLARKYLDALYILALRVGADMTRTHLAVPALQRFFLVFNKIYGDVDTCTETYKLSPMTESPSRSGGEHYVEVRRDGTTAEWAVRGRPLQISQLRIKDSDSADSFSPPTSFKHTPAAPEPVTNQAVEELRETFNSELAHTAFVPFLHYIGDTSMEVSLKNHRLIRELCFEYEQENQLDPKSNLDLKYTPDNTSDDIPVCVGSTGSFGTNVALVGNRIDVQFEQNESKQSHILNLVSNKMENTNRHLRGNWLAYWEHEIGRADKDTMFNFKQIKLQTFSGHTNTVKMVQVLDNENSFMSGSKDKTVKLWSLRSQGDGSAVTQCQSTYTGHKKSVLSVTFLESMRLTASCDSVVHIWDPFMGSPISQLEGPRVVPVSMVKSMPAPSPVLLAATDTSVRLIDARLCTYVHELKVSLNPLGFIRCLTVCASGNWLAAGHSSGNIVVLDGRTGLVISAWKAHDGEILQLASLGEHTLVSSSLDQAVSVWNVNDGKLKFNMKGATEPIHCLSVYNSELISGSTANRIGVHTSVDADASFSSTRLRSDTFKGVLTSMAILPLNRLLLLGADSGNISLLC